MVGLVVLGGLGEVVLEGYLVDFVGDFEWVFMFVDSGVVMGLIVM